MAEPRVEKGYAKCSSPRFGDAAVFVVLGGLATALMVNVAGILSGYGLVYAVMLYAIWRYRPKTAAVLVLGAELIALPFYLFPSSLFTSVAIANVFVRPLIVYFVALISERTRSKLVGALSLTVAETSIALAVDLVGFGATEAGFAIFGILLVPFVYVIVTFWSRNGPARILGALAGIASLLAYYFSFYSFTAILSGASAVVSLVLLLFASSRPQLGQNTRIYCAVALVIVVFGLSVGGSPLQNNLTASLYPLNPHSWTGARWEQTNSTGVCPATQNVFSSTYSPSRPRIVNTCTTVTGTVGEDIDAYSDGDYTFELSVNKTYSGLSSLSNYLIYGGALHIEVVPADQHRVLDPIGGGLCPGDFVKVVGVFVIDTDHGMWSEIHPALNITILHRASNLAWPACVIGRNLP